MCPSAEVTRLAHHICWLCARNFYQGRVARDLCWQGVWNMYMLPTCKSWQRWSLTSTEQNLCDIDCLAVGRVLEGLMHEDRLMIMEHLCKHLRTQHNLFTFNCLSAKLKCLQTASNTNTQAVEQLASQPNIHGRVFCVAQSEHLTIISFQIHGTNTACKHLCERLLVADNFPCSNNTVWVGGCVSRVASRGWYQFFQI